VVKSSIHVFRPNGDRGLPLTEQESALAETVQSDEVLEALDALLAVLRDSTRRNQDATRRAQTIRRLRSHGRSYREILSRAERALILQITRENLDGLLQASSRLRRAETRALYAEGMTMEEIASLFGVTRQRVSVLLRDGAPQGEASQ
jgi:hypothetical protein